MKIATTVLETRNTVKNWRKEGYTVGLVPTMGFLHDGPCFRTVSAVNAQTYWTVTHFLN